MVHFYVDWNFFLFIFFILKTENVLKLQTQILLNVYFAPNFDMVL